MKLWPFSKPDKRNPTAGAVAIVDSMRDEPQRWSLMADDYLVHDSGIVVGAGGFVFRPNLDDEPDANGTVIAWAVDSWIAAKMRTPPIPATAPAAEGT